MLGNVLQIVQKEYSRTRIGKPTSNKNKGNATGQPTGWLRGGGRLGRRLGGRLGRRLGGRLGPFFATAKAVVDQPVLAIATKGRPKRFKATTSLVAAAVVFRTITFRLFRRGLRRGFALTLVSDSRFGTLRHASITVRPAVLSANGGHILRTFAYWLLLRRGLLPTRGFCYANWIRFGIRFSSLTFIEVQFVVVNKATFRI